MRKKNVIFSLLCCLTATIIVGCSQTNTNGGGLVWEDMGPGNSVNNPSSDVEDPKDSEMPGPVDAISALTTPQAVYYDETNGALSWNADENAENGWKVKITKEKQVCVEEIVKTSSVELDTLAVGRYVAEIQAIAVEGKFYASAVVSYVFTVEGKTGEGATLVKMPQAQDFSYDKDADLLTWEEVSGNNGYVVEVYSEETRVMRYDGTTAIADTCDLDLGFYTAKLIVSGDGKTTVDSEPSVLNFTIASFGELTAPENLEILGGMLTWDSLAHTNGVDIYVLDYYTEEEVSASVVVEDGNKLSLAELGVETGNYKIFVAWTSSRHDSSISAYSEYGLSLEYAVSYSPKDIVGFAGELPVGEHGGARLVERDGNQYAEIYPTKDGWGRVGGSKFLLDFDRNPIVFISVGYVYGGYHLQLKEGDTTYLIVPDSNRLGNVSADIVAKTWLNGKSDVYLRLGVNGSTSTDANDARVHYSGITVFYAEEIQPPETVQLDPVTDMKVNLFGEVEWTAPTNGECNAYDVRVQIKGTDVVVCEGESTDPRVALYHLADGIYTVSVKAKNTLWKNVIDSEEKSFNVKVSNAVRYSASDLDTSTGIFQTGAQGIEAIYDAEKEYTLFNSTNKTDWGWISPKEGITVDMSRNPLVVIRTMGVKGGFFAKQEFDGQSITDALGNTSLSYEGEGCHVIRANANANAQKKETATWNGIKTGYKFHLGSLGKADGSYKETCQILLTGIDVVYVSEYVEIPDTPTKLVKPTDFAVNGSVVSAKVVAGNVAYTPVYELAVVGEGVNYKAENLATPSVDINALPFVYGEVYTITIKAVGDGVYFTDSDSASVKIRHTLKREISDFTSINVSKREGEGKILSQDENGLVYSASDGKWVLFAMEIPLEEDGGNYTLELAFGEITNGTRLAGRYYTGSEGAKNTYNLGGDSAIESNETRYYDMQNATLSNDSFYLGIGMGGDSGERQIQLKSVRIWALELVEEE